MDHDLAPSANINHIHNMLKCEQVTEFCRVEQLIVPMATPCTTDIDRSLFGHFANKFSVERVATGGGGGAERRGGDSVGADL